MERKKSIAVIVVCLVLGTAAAAWWAMTPVQELVDEEDVDLSQYALTVLTRFVISGEDGLNITRYTEITKDAAEYWSSVLVGEAEVQPFNIISIGNYTWPPERIVNRTASVVGTISRLSNITFNVVAVFPEFEERVAIDGTGLFNSLDICLVATQYTTIIFKPGDSLQVYVEVSIGRKEATTT